MPYLTDIAADQARHIAYLYYRHMAKDMGLDDVQFIQNKEASGWVVIAWRDGVVTATCEIPETVDMDVVVGMKIRELAKQLEDLNA